MMVAPKTDDTIPIRRLATQIPENVAHLLWAQLRGQLAMRRPAA